MRREKTSITMADVEKRSKKSGRDLGLSNLLIGLIFLINPYYGVIDVLPDFIGMILVYKSIVKLSDLDERLHDSKKNYLAALWVSVAMFFAMGLGVFSGGMDKTTTLTIMLAAHILYCILLIPAFKNLFNAMDYGNIRKDGKVDEKGSTSNLTITTSVFLVVRGICAFAPWLSALGQEDELNSGSALDLFFIILAGVVTLIFGVIWFVSVRKYMKAFFKDRVLMDYFYERYQNEVANDKDLWFRRGITKFTLYSLIAYAFTLSFPIDGYYFVPGFVFSLFMYLAAKSILPYAENIKKFKTSLICFGVFSFARYAVMLFYSITYEFVSSPYNPKMSDTTKFWIVYSVIVVLTVVSCVFMIMISKQHHTYRKTLIIQSVGKAENDSSYRDEMDKARIKELNNKSVAVLVFQIIYAIGSVATTMMIPFGEISDAFGLQWLYRLLLLAGAMIGIYAVSLAISNEASRIK